MAREGFLLFAFGRRRYAIALHAIDGVEPADALRPVPGAPPLVRGVAPWRGRLLTVLDLPAAVDDGSSVPPACLLRLAPPHDGLAVYLPTSAKIGHARAEAKGTDLAWGGCRHRLLSVGELVRSVLERRG